MIREATFRDYDELNRLEMQVASKHLTARPDIFKNPLEWSVDVDYLEWILENHQTKIFVYEENGRVLGHCKVDFEEPSDDDEDESYTQHDVPILFIESMVVDTAARGRGIGRELIDRAKAYAKEVGAKRLELCVWALNGGVQEFYEHLGMKVQSTQMEFIID
ncbi:MAG: GNAT family N-acetyltransferase [Defluviitaleaceae bacterium]|nr:GNAT family N-acetyltransferase [Defluviitaleaceae bacterium]